MLSFVGNINDSEYDTVNEVVAEAQPLLRPGARMLNTLDTNYRFDVNYNREIASNFDGFGNLSLSHSGDRLQGNAIIAEPYNILSLTAGIRYGDWELAFVGNNLTDERGPTFLGNTGPLSGSGPTPRTLGLRLRVTSW